MLRSWDGDAGDNFIPTNHKVSPFQAGESLAFTKPPNLLPYILSPVRDYPYFLSWWFKLLAEVRERFRRVIPSVVCPFKIFSPHLFLLKKGPKAAYDTNCVINYVNHGWDFVTEQGTGKGALETQRDASVAFISISSCAKSFDSTLPTPLLGGGIPSSFSGLPWFPWPAKIFPIHLSLHVCYVALVSFRMFSHFRVWILGAKRRRGGDQAWLTFKTYEKQIISLCGYLHTKYTGNSIPF